jgi:ribonucleoside-diphosphate reductase alpha chain/ribonucleoside-triphosphate reductase
MTIKMFQTYWSDNQVSATVYYTPEELPLVQDWLDKNYDEGIKSISFLLKQNHGFDQAPIEPISAEVFREKSDAITGQLGDVQGDLLEMDECSSGACPIR